MIILYVTHPDEITAKKIIGILLEQHLIACANIFPIESTYWWKGAQEQAQEVVTLLKTRKELASQVEIEIKKHHPYEIPCIMRMEMTANKEYEEWIEKETEKGQKDV